MGCGEVDELAIEDESGVQIHTLPVSLLVITWLERASYRQSQRGGYRHRQTRIGRLHILLSA